VNDVTRAGSAAAARLDAVTAQLRALGYTPRLADVDLQARGEWRRVLVGEFSTVDEAAQHAKRLHQTKDFADAQPIRY
jgi:cell division protein FtsN